MGSIIECFWMVPVEMVRTELRRYERHEYSPMPPPSCHQNRMQYHDASVDIGDTPEPLDPKGLLGRTGELSHSDLRWPKGCETCGLPFKDDDHWQVNIKRLFAGAPDGKLYTSRNMPPGAMYDATWWGVPGPDGITLTVVLPPDGGDDVWHPDSPSISGGAWTRTGTVPKVTCSPSILTPRYHGWLRDGRLVEC